ncbi:MAG TPA: PLP-dependent transferase [Thermoanaerobaculia bacterium]|nr:PLP-dependent transferase [Thermoanaerobaculia bacterium]
MRFETISVHAGGGPDPATGALAPAIHPSTTYRHAADGAPLHGRLYVREGNPTEDRLESALAALEGGESALAFASGSAAAAALLQALPEGISIAFHRDLYHGVLAVAREFLPRWGKDALFADLGDPDETRIALAQGARVVWVETPTNPRLEIIDLRELAALAHEAGALLVVDGTFATPALQQPLALGADVVLHSTTKYLGGHSDVLGGALVFARDPSLAELAERARHVRHMLGGIASPFGSWLVLRGLRSLACRMERHSANALAVAHALAAHPKIAHVLYPGLASHPGHETASRQMRAFGGMIALRVGGGREAAIGVAARLELFTNATSLGGVESLVEHRASVEGPGSTAPDDLLRLSIGLEHPDDLVDDLVRALAG